MAQREEKTLLTNDEKLAIAEYAESRGITADEAATELASRAIERRMRRQTGRSPARNIVKLRRG